MRNTCSIYDTTEKRNKNILSQSIVAQCSPVSHYLYFQSMVDAWIHKCMHGWMAGWLGRIDRPMVTAIRRDNITVPYTATQANLEL
jgi:hypothetical protein